MRVITLAYDDPFPPLAFNDEGTAKGAAIDILSEALVGIQVRFIPSPMDRVKHLLDAREADGIAFYAITPEREIVFEFSDSFLLTGAALFVKSPEPAPSGLAECQGKRIVTPKTGPLSKFIESKAPEAALLLVKDYRESLEAVLEGKADAAALNIHVGGDLIQRKFTGQFSIPQKPFLELPLAVAMLKGSDPLLLRQINEGLRRLKKEGAYAGILERWLSTL